MSKKMIFTLSMFVAVLALSFNSITTHAMGFTPDDDPTLVQLEDETSEESDAGIYSDVNEMADRIVTTEDNILIMSDRIIETEEIVAGVSPADEFDSEVLDASSDVRDVMDDALIENMLPETVIFEDALPENETLLALSDDIGEMADRILESEDEISEMADNIVETEQILADTAEELDFTPEITADDAEIAPELADSTLEKIDETTPSTDTVTDATPVDSLGETDPLSLSDDIGDMADNIVDTEGDIGETGDNIVETENELSDSLVSFWN